MSSLTYSLKLDNLLSPSRKGIFGIVVLVLREIKFLVEDCRSILYLPRRMYSKIVNTYFSVNSHHRVSQVQIGRNLTQVCFIGITLYLLKYVYNKYLVHIFPDLLRVYQFNHNRFRFSNISSLLRKI